LLIAVAAAEGSALRCFLSSVLGGIKIKAIHPGGRVLDVNGADETVRGRQVVQRGVLDGPAITADDCCLGIGFETYLERLQPRGDACAARLQPSFLPGPAAQKGALSFLPGELSEPGALALGEEGFGNGFEFRRWA